jgi:hypothetical protein
MRRSQRPASNARQAGCRPLDRSHCAGQGFAAERRCVMRPATAPLAARSICKRRHKLSCLHPRAVRGCRQETLPIRGVSNRPWQRGVCPMLRASSSSLGPLEGSGGPGEGLCRYTREGASDERSVRTSHAGPSYGRQARCLAEPSRSKGRQPETLDGHASALREVLREAHWLRFRARYWAPGAVQ